MTTDHGTDLFDLVDDEGGADGPDDARPAQRHVLVTFVVAAVLLLGGVVWLIAARAGGAEAPAMAVELLERAQEPADELPAVVADETGVDPSTARAAVTTTAGAYVAALRWNGDLCLVVVPEGDLARVSCVAPRADAAVTLTGEDGSRVRLVADGGDAPTPAADWQASGPNVWVAPAPAEG